MKTHTQEYIVLIEVADEPLDTDKSSTIEEALESGLLPEDGIAVVSVTMARSCDQ